MNVFSNKMALGIICGVVVAFFVTFGGWLGLMWLILFTAIGGLVGAQLDGKLDLASIISATSGRGRS
ncbi:hypothetical protein [Corynebacterium timonense]|uniref:Small integral membrane protein n=1 Tax=Corynebacterium timonense TaxID=441500 RepID=A0A1H1STJ3_9CORY|nr:hypothetical protein [Corynebacterium timonense]SDS51340.1 hypothetical protein SAMN04488539_1821 [Corynebacterium timonense]